MSYNVSIKSKIRQGDKMEVIGNSLRCTMCIPFRALNSTVNGCSGLQSGVVTQ